MTTIMSDEEFEVSIREALQRIGKKRLERKRKSASYRMLQSINSGHSRMVGVKPAQPHANKDQWPSSVRYDNSVGQTTDARSVYSTGVSRGLEPLF